MATRAAQLRVGLLVLGAIVVLMAGLFLIGRETRLFASKNRYYFTIASAAGLNEGNPVRLNGVTVGLVEKINLPEDVRKQLLTVRISIERQYEERIRVDSKARVRTMGLLGDKYVEVSSGSPESPMIPPGGAIPTAPDTDVDKLIASGGDVVDNMVRISYSLTRILDRIDRGEGLVGALTTGESGKISERLDATIASAQRVMTGIESGKGPLGRMVHDEKLANQLASSIVRLESVMAQAERGDNLAATFLRSPTTRADFEATLAEAKQAAAALRQWTAAVESTDSVANRLLTDQEMGERVGRDLEAIVRDLASFAGKLDRGEGSVSKLINDPQIYDAVNDIIVGVNESKMLRWLIRNRQKKGIKTRYQAEGGPPLRSGEEGSAEEPAEAEQAAPGTGAGADGEPFPAPTGSAPTEVPSPAVPPAATPAPTPPS